MSSLPPGSESLSKSPDILQVPHPSVGPQEMAAALEEGDGRHLVLECWSDVTGSSGKVVHLQYKKNMVPSIFDLNLFFLPVPMPRTYCTLVPSSGAVLEGDPAPRGVPAP